MNPKTVKRLRPFGATIFAEMSALAVQHDAINLGQGFPDEDGPASMLDAAQQAIRSGLNQYPPGLGVPELRRAIAADRLARYGEELDPDTRVLVTVGATEEIAGAVLGRASRGGDGGLKRLIFLQDRQGAGQGRARRGPGAFRLGWDGLGGGGKGDEDGGEAEQMKAHGGRAPGAGHLP